MSKKLLIAIAVLLVIVAGVYLALRKPASKSTTSSSQPSSSVQAAATITYSGHGFSPSSVTVKSGDVVALKNTASDNVQFQSNPHPVHTDDADLNVGTVTSGQTKTFTVTKKGTFGYHNHLNPSEAGSITIQ